MATYPKILKPWRGFPNMNGMHGIAIHIDQAPPAQDVYGQPGRGTVALALNKAYHIGTIPKGSILFPASGFVSTAFTATTTLKVGSQITSGVAQEDVLATATIAPQTVGRKENLAIGAKGASPLTADLPVFIVAEVAAPLAGVMSLVIPFYIHRD